MTPLAGFIIAVVAGWIVRDPRRAAANVIVPFLAVLAAQSWRIAAGDGTSPPGTVTSFPHAAGYWVLQAIFLALALGIAAELGALRARRALHDPAARAGRRAVIAAAVLAALTAVFDAVYVLASAPVRHHAAEGAPPVPGAAGMVLCIVTFAVLSVLTFRHRRAVARARAAAAVPSTGMTAPGVRR